MAWSTREVAELAGTSLRAVRHYHDIGLLDEPERTSNGYKQYGVAHVIRVLRIKRLADLGFSLSQIAAMGDSPEHPEEALRALDAELAATIDRLQRARLELSSILSTAAPTDLPVDFVPPEAMVGMSDADRAAIVVLTRVLGPRGLQTYADLLRNLPPEKHGHEFDVLPADAEESVRQALAEKMAPEVRALQQAHPGLADVHVDARGGARRVQEVLGRVIEDLHNPAQLDVLRRVRQLLEDPEPAL